MILFHRIRFLFQGWKRFTDLIQTFFFVLLTALFSCIGVYGIIKQGWSQGRWSTECFYGIALVMLFFLNKKKLRITRALSLIGILWTTLLWLETLLPGAIYEPIGLLYIKNLGYEYLCLSAFSVISLFGLGYPFSWIGKSRIGLMIAMGLGVSLVGFLLLSGLVEFERTLDYSYVLNLLCASIYLVLCGAIILVKGIQDCLDEGAGYWPHIPYAAASVMFLLTMVLWSGFHIHEQQIWSREIESYTTRFGDRLEQKLVSLSLELERFSRIAGYWESIRPEEWQEEVRVFLGHEKIVFGVDRFPKAGADWKIVRSPEEDYFKGISNSVVEGSFQKSFENKTVWTTLPFPIRDHERGIGLVSVVNYSQQKVFGLIMGIEFKKLFFELFDDESCPVDFRISVQDAILKDFEMKSDQTVKCSYKSEIYYFGTSFLIEAVPKSSFFQKRDRFLSMAFFIAGLAFSILFGALIGLYIHLHHDSLELREINERLGLEIEDRRAAENAGERKNRDLETLIYVVSHDLREPLRGIESFSRLIYERYLDRLDEKGQDFLRRIVFSSMRLDRLLDDITMLSRVQRAEVPDNPVGGRELVMEALSRLEAVSKAKNAIFTLDRDLPLLWVDRTWGTQAIFNLIGNALKFTIPDKDPEIWIKGYRSENGDQEGIQILDRGPGVKAEHVERIFKLFQRAVGREIEGTGAGLAIVKQIVERHGGTIFYEDREGGGSSFTITFKKRDRPLMGQAVTL